MLQLCLLFELLQLGDLLLHLLLVWVILQLSRRFLVPGQAQFSFFGNWLPLRIATTLLFQFFDSFGVPERVECVLTAGDCRGNVSDHGGLG